MKSFRMRSECGIGVIVGVGVGVAAKVGVAVGDRVGIRVRVVVNVGSASSSELAREVDNISFF